jgi:hypothetical protein
MKIQTKEKNMLILMVAIKSLILLLLMNKQKKKQSQQSGGIDYLFKRGYISNKTFSEAVKEEFENAVYDFFIACNIPFVNYDSKYFAKLFAILGYTLPLGGRNRLYNNILYMGDIYKINLHQILQDITSVDLVFALWESGDNKSTWFLCCVVAFINSNFDREQHILCFKGIKKSGLTGRYIAEQIKQTTDEFNVSYKVCHIALDSASNNIKFGADFKDLVTYELKNGVKDELEKLVCFKGTSSLVRCSAHIIHNSTLSLVKNFNHVILRTEDAKYEMSELAVAALNIETLGHGSLDISNTLSSELMHVRIGDDTQKSCSELVDLEKEGNAENEDDDNQSNKAYIDTMETNTDFESYRMLDGVNSTLNTDGDEVYNKHESDKLIKSTIDAYLYRGNDSDIDSEIESDIDSDIDTAMPQLQDDAESENYQPKFISYNVVEASKVILRYRNFVKHTRHNEAWNEACNKEELTFKNLCLDVKTRWNSTYKMLEEALKYQKAILHYTERHMSEKSFKLPKDHDKCAVIEMDDFTSLSVLHQLLKNLNVLTDIASAVGTSSSYWRQILRDLDFLFTDIQTGDFFEGLEFDETVLCNLKRCGYYGNVTLQKYHRAADESLSLLIAELFNPILARLLYVKTDDGLKVTDAAGKERLGDNVCRASFSVLPKSIEDLKNLVLEETYLEVLREINIKTLSNVNCISPKIIQIDSIQNYVDLKNSMVNDLKKNLHSCQTGTPEKRVEESTQTVRRTRFFGNQVLIDEDEVIEISDEMKNLEHSLRSSVDFNNPNEHFDSINDIELYCDSQWCIKRVIQNELDAYFELLNNSKVLQEYLRKQINND